VEVSESLASALQHTDSFIYSGIKKLSMPIYPTKSDHFIFSPLVEEVVLPENISSIGDRAFYKYYSLSKINLGTQITSVGPYAFYGCGSLTLESDFFNNLTECSNCAFAGEDSSKPGPSWNGELVVKSNFNLGIFTYGGVIPHVIIPESVVGTVSSSFIRDSRVQKISILSSQVTSVGDFEYLKSLKEVYFNEGINIASCPSFRECRALKKVNIPSSVTSISSMGFYYCSALEEITLPAGITAIPGNCFGYCSALKTITSLALVAPSVSSNTFGSSHFQYTGSNHSSGKVLYVPSGATGYDASYWGTVLLAKCYFTLSATL
jgi:hypothetical protein